jgi:hypothetical protein
MTTINAVGNGLSGATGTGTFVGSTSPTLVTPTLGVATATSINFGGGALSTYIPNTNFTPTFTFATPGDLTVAYAIQTGIYSVVGSLVFITYTIRFTPTYTTASGSAQFASLPFTCSANGAYRLTAAISESTTWPTSSTYIYGGIPSSTSYINLNSNGSGTAAGVFSTTNLPTGTQKTVVFCGYYST